MKARNLTLLLLCLLMPFAALAKTWQAADVPMVHLQDARKYVCDPENILTQQARDSADSYLYRLDKQCGIESVVVIVGHVKDGDAFRMCQDIFDKYGVGDKKTRRGIVITIAVDDRKYFIEPGYGLEQDLTDVECDDIGRMCIAANMRTGNADDAVLSTTKALYTKFKTGKLPATSRADGNQELSWGTVFLIVIIVWIIALIFRNRGGRGGGGGFFWAFPFFMGGSGPYNHDIGDGFGGGSFGGGGAGGGGAGGGW